MDERDGQDKAAPAARGGSATDVFGTVRPAAPAPAEAVPSPAPPREVAAKPINVQDVVIQPDEKNSHGDTGALRRLLEATRGPAAVTPAAAEPAASPAATASSGAQGGFTQLFGTLPPAAATAPSISAPAAAVPVANASIEAAPAAAPGELTRLLSRFDSRPVDRTETPSTPSTPPAVPTAPAI